MANYEFKLNQNDRLVVELGSKGEVIRGKIMNGYTVEAVIPKDNLEALSNFLNGLYASIQPSPSSADQPRTENQKTLPPSGSVRPK
jgi:hypothetical protein